MYKIHSVINFVAGFLAGVCLPDEMNKLIPICKNFALTGTKKQAKQAVRCLYVNVYRVDENIFNDTVEVASQFIITSFTFTRCEST